MMKIILFTVIFGDSLFAFYISRKKAELHFKLLKETEGLVHESLHELLWKETHVIHVIYFFYANLPIFFGFKKHKGNILAKKLIFNLWLFYGLVVLGLVLALLSEL